MQEQARIAALFILAAAWSAPSATAHAIALPPAQWQFVNGELPLVNNGVLLFRLSNAFNGSPEPTLAPMVTNSSGEAVAGTVELLTVDGTARYGIFRPTMPPPVGDAYQVVDPSFGSSSFAITSTMTLDAPMPTFPTTVAVQQVPTQSLCCVGASQLQTPGGVNVCLAVRSQEVPLLTIGIALDANDSVARQFLYQVRLTSPMEAVPSSAWVPASEAGLMRPFTPMERAAEYCYSVEAMRITDGERFTLGEGCEGDDLGMLAEVQPTEEQVTAALSLFTCIVPPAELTQAWCDVNRATCMDPVQQPNCETSAYASTCASFPPSDLSLTEQIANLGNPNGSMAGSGGAAAAGGASGAGAGNAGASGIGGASGTSGTGGASGMTAMDPVAGSSADSNSDDDGGCSVARIESRSPIAAVSAWLVLAALTFTVARASRRKQRGTRF